MANYTVTTTVGGTDQPSSTWVLNSPNNPNNLIAVNISSDGTTLTGTYQCKTKGPVGFSGKYAINSNHDVDVTTTWGGSTHPGGTWKLGHPNNSNKIIALNVSASDDGTTLTGTCQHTTQGVLDCKCVLQG